MPGILIVGMNGKATPASPVLQAMAAAAITLCGMGNAVAAAWTALDTPHFTIYSQVPEKRARAIFSRLHVYMQALPVITNLPAKASQVPTRVFLVDDENFARIAVGRGDIDGMFMSGPFGADIIINASQDPESSLSIIQHEYVHFSIRNAGVTAIPVFYEEGLAQMVQSFRLEGRRFNWGYYPSGYRKSAASKALPLTRVLAITVDSEDYVAKHSQEPFYARSLLFLHYCLVGNRACHEPLLRLVTRLANGDPEVAAFTEEFGKSPEEFDRELDTYLSRRPEDRSSWMPASTIDAKPVMVSRTLKAGEAEIEFGNLLLNASPLDGGLVEWFERQLRIQEWHDRALSGIAVALEERGMSDAADIRIDELDALPTASSNALSQVGELLLKRASRLASTQPPMDAVLLASILRQARSYFEAALQRDPLSARAAFGYGLTQIYMPDDLAASARILNEAYQRSPANAELAMLLAIHHHELGDRQSALSIMRVAACRAVSPDIRQLAREHLGTVRCFQPR